MRDGLLIVPVLIAVSGLVAGCATKAFVREELGQSEAKLGQQVGQLQSDLGQERTRVSGVTAQVTEARAVAEGATRRAEQATGLAGQAATTAGEAQTRAGQAASRADEALAKADQTDGRLSRLWANRAKRNLGDVVVILFGFDRWQLDDRAETALLDVARQLTENPALVVDLEGYTDSVGVTPYNVQLSQRRAEAVRRFLVEKGVDLHRIQSIGLGDIRPVADNNTKDGRNQNRRVAVRLFTPAD